MYPDASADGQITEYQERSLLLLSFSRSIPRARPREREWDALYYRSVYRNCISQRPIQSGARFVPTVYSIVYSLFSSAAELAIKYSIVVLVVQWISHSADWRRRPVRRDNPERARSERLWYCSCCWSKYFGSPHLRRASPVAVVAAAAAFENGE